MENRKKTVATIAATLLISGMGYAPAASAVELPDLQQDTQQTSRPSGESYASDAASIPWAVNGFALTYDETRNLYSGSSSAPLDQSPAESLYATSVGNTVQLALQPSVDEQIADSALGQVSVSGTAQWQGTDSDERTLSFSQPYSYVIGMPTSMTVGGQPLQPILQDGVFQAAATLDLDTRDNPSADMVEVNGAEFPISWQEAVTTDTVGTTAVTRTGTATGTLDVQGHLQKWEATLVASRTQGKVDSLSLIRSAADGTTSTVAVEGFTPTRTQYAITLPADAADDALSLGYSATDAATVTEEPGVPVQVQADGTTVLSITLNGTTYHVSVRFETPIPVPQQNNARLEGIYVNYDGTAVKGNLIAGWDPNILDYTLTIGENDPGVYVLPVAPQGVTVKASDVKQAGYSTEQAWQVTAEVDGQQRTYTVSVVRQHSTPTATEAFAPKTAHDVDGETPSTSATNTQLKSHGYVLDGTYHPVAQNTFTIPQGGHFAYASYAGQTVTVKQSTKSPMEYQYDLGVIAPDGKTIGKHTYLTVYLTALTHTATLQMISVNNVEVNGFAPDRTEYTVPVADTDHWVVTPKFDKTTGMEVHTHKDGSTATITVTSADGLVRKTYTVHAVPRVSPTETAEGTQPIHYPLADTGSPIGTVVASAAISLVFGALLLSSRRRSTLR